MVLTGLSTVYQIHELSQCVVSVFFLMVFFFLATCFILSWRAGARERAEELMRELDRDIAAMLDQDLATPDHNADKKSTVDEDRGSAEVTGGRHWYRPLFCDLPCFFFLKIECIKNPLFFGINIMHHSLPLSYYQKKTEYIGILIYFASMLLFLSELQ